MNTTIRKFCAVCVASLFTMQDVSGGEVDENRDAGKKAEFFAQAISNEKYTIALCKGLPLGNVKGKRLLKDGSHVLQSNFFHIVGSAGALVEVVKPIKGDFDRLIVYEEYHKLGRIWPAFKSSNFFPDENSQYIVVFEEDTDGRIIEIRHSDTTIPVLGLASKEFGIIRYDQPNHLGIDAEEFLGDLKRIVKHLEEEKELSAEQLKTEMGKMVLDRVASP